MDYCIVRVISDAGDSDASMDYDKFCDKLAGVVCFGILKNVVEIMWNMFQIVIFRIENTKQKCGTINLNCGAW